MGDSTALDFAKRQLDKLVNIMTLNENMVRNIIILLVIIIIVSLSIYLSNKMSYEKDKCGDLSKIYDDMGTVSSIDPNKEPFTQYKLRDFYVETAYNCCALGDFKNTFVSLCALKEVIRQGVRVLDFEIYSVDNKPVVAVSSISSYDIKESYNYINLSDVLEVINDRAYSGQYCPNPNDP